MSTTDDDADCSACNIHSNILTQCDKCLKWFCYHCHGLPPDIVTQMPSIVNAGLLWLCKQCCGKPFATKPTIIEYMSLHTQTATPTLHLKPTTTEYASLHTQTSNPTLIPTLNPPNSSLNNLLTGRTLTISHIILGATETLNDSTYLTKPFASINIYKKPYVHHHRIPHPKSSSPTKANQHRSLSLTYLTYHKAKHSTTHSLHLLQ